MKRSMRAASLAGLLTLATAHPAFAAGAAYVELGASAGAYMPPKDHELLGLSDSHQVPYKTLGVDLNLHLAVFPIQWLGAEIEGGMSPIGTSTDQSADVYFARAHLVAQLPWVVTPFVLAGGGFIAVRSGSDALGSDVDRETHFGAGLKVRVSDRVIARLDVRDLLSAKLEPHSGYAQHFEAFAGISIAFGSHDDEEPPQLQPVLAQAAPAQSVKPPEPEPSLEPEPIALEAASRFSPESIQSELDRVHFAWGKYRLEARYLEALENVARTLADHPEIDLEIDGHTDSTGPDRFNVWLSRRRAETVRRFLLERGVSADRLSIRGRGPWAPISSNATREGRAKNRRSELKVNVQGAILSTK